MMPHLGVIYLGRAPEMAIEFSYDASPWGYLFGKGSHRRPQFKQFTSFFLFQITPKKNSGILLPPVIKLFNCKGIALSISTGWPPPVISWLTNNSKYVNLS